MRLVKRAYVHGDQANNAVYACRLASSTLYLAQYST